MKKVILSAMVVGSLLATSCKETKEAGKDLKESTEKLAKDGAEAVKEGAGAVADGVKEGAAAISDAYKSAVDGVTIPKFEDPKVSEHLQEYTEYAKDYMEAGADAYKDAEIVKKGEELAAEGKEIVKGLDEKATAKYNAFVTTLKAKMAPAK